MSGAQRYSVVPASLPAALPALTREQGIKLANVVLRKFWPDDRRRTYWANRWAHEGRRVWVSTLPTHAGNHAKGVGRLVHDLSHEIFEAVYPMRKPHDPLHVKYEADVAAYVAHHSLLARFINPPVKPAPVQLSKRELRERKLSRTRASIARWESKARRAVTALRKLKASERGLLRALDNQPLGSTLQ